MPSMQTLNASVFPVCSVMKPEFIFPPPLGVAQWYGRLIWDFRFPFKVAVLSLSSTSKSSPRAKTSSNTSVSPVLLQKQTAVVPATSQPMHRINGSGSKPITHVTLKPRWKSKINSQTSPCRIRYGMNTTSTKPSTIPELLLI